MLTAQFDQKKTDRSKEVTSLTVTAEILIKNLLRQNTETAYLNAMALSDDDIPALCRAILRNHHIHHVELYMNGISDRSLGDLTALIQCPHIQSLDVSHNHLTLTGVQVLFNAIDKDNVVLKCEQQTELRQRSTPY